MSEYEGALLAIWPAFPAFRWIGGTRKDRPTVRDLLTPVAGDGATQTDLHAARNERPQPVIDVKERHRYCKGEGEENSTTEGTESTEGELLNVA